MLQIDNTEMEEGRIMTTRTNWGDRRKSRENQVPRPPFGTVKNGYLSDCGISEGN